MKRRRRGALVGILLVGVAIAGLGARFVGVGPDETSTASGEERTLAAAQSSLRPMPVEVRGVHVTMGLASLSGRLQKYVDMKEDGLTAIQLDVKDEDGQVGFVAGTPRLARSVGAAHDFYDAREAARLVHKNDLYLIGRIVTFEDPYLSQGRPEMAARRSDGSVWKDAAGLGWTNPYDKRVWDYNVAIAKAAARHGFDEIMFDYVRFPSDGDVSNAIFRNPRGLKKNDAVPRFLAYAAKQLEPMGVRVSAALFGLSAARDMGIGQIPRRIAKHVHAIYAMTYPSLFGPGELGIADPAAAPGATVSRALKRFKKALKGRNAQLLPWVQDWSSSVTYGRDEVREQVFAARIAGAKGYLLWNASGVYTPGTLTPPS